MESNKVSEHPSSMIHSHYHHKVLILILNKLLCIICVIYRDNDFDDQLQVTE